MKRSRRQLLILPGIISAVLIAFVYSLTHETGRYPTLYWAMAKAISNNGYLIPKQINHFTAGGIPFGYPPLAFYTLAAVSDITNLSYRFASYYLRIIYFIGTPVTAYFLTTQFSNGRSASVASVLIAVSSPIFLLHLGQGGFVRGLAFVLSLTTLTLATRALKSSERRYYLTAGVVFGLTVLTHPTYAVFAGVGTASLWLGIDRSRSGFKIGATIAITGFLIASPWLLYVVTTHGPDIFFQASQTHGGLLSFTRHVNSLLSPPDSGIIERGIWVLGIGSLAVLAHERRYGLVVLFVGVGLMLGGRLRFTYTILVISVSILIVEYLSRHFEQNSISVKIDMTYFGKEQFHQVVPVFAAIFLLLPAVYAGIGGAEDLPKEPYSNADSEAVEWVRNSTSTNATFITQFREEEFPYFANRTNLIVPWGAEWEGPEAFANQLRMKSEISGCQTAGCFSSFLQSSGYNPDYLYLYNEYINIESFNRNKSFEIVYQNKKVVIVKHMYDDVEHSSNDTAGIESRQVEMSGDRWSQ
ncbi:glycosyltransferase family 39 protein [Haloarcula sp. JP-L23]|uniref:glycosyltransferase family 39 protein n=1 Tax=Haloarcula sp. JP-L23 TaxID=2716717 RepID=UPI00140ED74A|nr:hypothetical protein G9465_00160 [Haloarcula sp. JP-L23]